MKTARRKYIEYADELVQRAAKEQRPLSAEEEDLVAEYQHRVEEIDLTEQILTPNSLTIQTRQTHASEHGTAS